MIQIRHKKRIPAKHKKRPKIITNGQFYLMKQMIHGKMMYVCMYVHMKLIQAKTPQQYVCLFI